MEKVALQKDNSMREHSDYYGASPFEPIYIRKLIKGEIMMLLKRPTSRCGANGEGGLQE